MVIYCPVEVDLFQAAGRAGGRKLIAALRTFAKALKHSHKIRSTVAQADLRVCVRIL